MALILIKPSRKKMLVSTITYCSLMFVLWNLPSVNSRVMDAYEQVKMYSDNRFNSSTGIRVKLWEAGLEISQESLVLGHSKRKIAQLSERKIAQKYSRNL